MYSESLANGENFFSIALVVINDTLAILVRIFIHSQDNYTKLNTQTLLLSTLKSLKSFIGEYIICYVASYPTNKMFTILLSLSRISLVHSITFAPVFSSRPQKYQSLLISSESKTSSIYSKFNKGPSAIHCVNLKMTFPDKPFH